MPEEVRYHFGPLERRGLIAGWRGGQIAIVAAALVIDVGILNARPSAADVAAAIGVLGAAAGVACVPIHGRTTEEWVPTLLRWFLGGHRSMTFADSVHVDEGGRRRPPPPRGPFRGLRIIDLAEARTHGGGAGRASGIGAIEDTRDGSLSCVLAVRGHSFALLGTEEQERRISSWAGVLATLRSDRSAIARVQWLAISSPDDIGALWRSLDGDGRVPRSDPTRVSYEELLDETRTQTARHDVYVVVRSHGRRGSARYAGQRSGSLADPLRREIDLLARALEGAEVAVENFVGPLELSDLLRTTLTSTPDPGSHRRSGSTRDRIAAPPWPTSVESEWTRVRLDGCWFASFWISEWPRTEIGGDFLAPLLLGGGARRVSVTMEPVDARAAVKGIERSRTADIADAELRRRGGFLSTARRTREAQTVSRREQELADGHVSFRFSGYVTVAASSIEELDAACEEVQRDAAAARLELRRLYGDQVRAATVTMPLGRGLG